MLVPVMAIAPALMASTSWSGNIPTLPGGPSGPGESMAYLRLSHMHDALLFMPGHYVALMSVRVRE